MTKKKTAAASTDVMPDEQVLGDALEQEATTGDAETVADPIGDVFGDIASERTYDADIAVADSIGDVFGDRAYSRRSERIPALVIVEGQISPIVAALLQELEQRVANLEAWAEQAERGPA